MQLEKIAQAILYGARWEDKLCFDAAFEDEPRLAPLEQAPIFPGRPARLSQPGRAEFPKPESLGSDSARGRILHFFANHELLAMELMALMLLRFPEAPREFRAGVARTIGEEQGHLRLYVARMRELGVDFGDLSVSDYFWNAMKQMRSPMDFVVQMSLTLEQANLDFSLQYQQAVLKAGDLKTAEILAQVYRDEIAHVRHGLNWFNRWRGNAEEDDWDAYLRLLPAPMTPRRAKGAQFSAEARREAGFSERYIRELEVHSGSKGRPPVLWSYNPQCDAEISRGKPGFTPSQATLERGLDLETIPLFSALETDVVLVEQLPRAEWLKGLGEQGFAVPEFRLRGRAGAKPRENRIAGLEPWGWSPEPFERFKSWRALLSPAAGANGAWCERLLSAENFASTGMGELFSKSWSCAYLRGWLEAHPEHQGIFGGPLETGQSFSDWNSAVAYARGELNRGRALIAKAPWGTAGAQNRRILKESELDSKLGQWLKGSLATQGSIVIEPWLDAIADLSLQIEVGAEGTRVLGIRHFLTGPQMEYRGTELDSKLRSLGEEPLRFLHSEALKRWQEFARELGRELAQSGYQGAAGLDGLLWRDPGSRELRLKPLVELNPRWTMGRIALEIEKAVRPGVRARWLFLPVRELRARGLPEAAHEASEQLGRDHPPLRENGRGLLNEGIVFTTDPFRARSLLTLLCVGERALGDPRLRPAACITTGHENGKAPVHAARS